MAGPKQRVTDEYAKQVADMPPMPTAQRASGDQVMAAAREMVTGFHARKFCIEQVVELLKHRDDSKISPTGLVEAFYDFLTRPAPGPKD